MSPSTAYILGVATPFVIRYLITLPRAWKDSRRWR